MLENDRSWLDVADADLPLRRRHGGLEDALALALANRQGAETGSDGGAVKYVLCFEHDETLVFVRCTDNRQAHWCSLSGLVPDGTSAFSEMNSGDRGTAGRDKSLNLSELATDSSEDSCRDDRAELLTTIEQHVLPRIALAHAVKTPALLDCPGARKPPTHAEVAELVELAVGQNLSAALELVEQMSRDGLGFESLMVDLVGAASRRLGDDWLEDDRSFNEVTLGLGTLHQMIEVLGPSASPPLLHRGLVVLIAPHEEQHTLGVYLLAELLRREGWGVHVDPRLSDNELVQLIQTEPVALLGISVSNDELVPPLEALIGRVRASSKNPDVAVVMGGAADGLASDAERFGVNYCPTYRDVIELLGELAKRADEPQS